MSFLILNAASNKSPPAGRRTWAGELSGACGDLGTFVPYTLGAMNVAGMAPAGVLTGFGLFYLATGLFYRLPIPVQPMKAVSAVLLTSGLSAQAIAATGLLVGLSLLVLGLTGIIGRLAQAVPQSVTTGLQLGLGISLAWLSVGMMAETWWLSLLLVALLVALLKAPRIPSTLVALALAVVIGRWLGAGDEWPVLEPGITVPTLVVPGLEDLAYALHVTVLPQLALTLTNAVIVTAALSRELFGPRARRVSPSNLALSSGLANIALAPLGALPMCHGAGGLAAHYRFGARTGAPPVLLGIALLTLGVVFPDTAAALLSLIPTAAVGALLLLSAIELAWSKRLVDARPACLPIIGITAAATVLWNPLWGVLAGWGVEFMAARIGSRLQSDTSKRP